jgi:hypothetical protein
LRLAASEHIVDWHHEELGCLDAVLAEERLERFLHRRRLDDNEEQAGGGIVRSRASLNCMATATILAISSSSMNPMMD